LPIEIHLDLQTLEDIPMDGVCQRESGKAHEEVYQLSMSFSNVEYEERRNATQQDIEHGTKNCSHSGPLIR
jgi:hypothetical protein